MRKKLTDEAFAPVGPKHYWNPYSLQALRPEKFSLVVNAILRGDNRLLPVDRRRATDPGVFRPLFGD